MPLCHLGLSGGPWAREEVWGPVRGRLDSEGKISPVVAAGQGARRKTSGGAAAPGRGTRTAFWRGSGRGCSAGPGGAEWEGSDLLNLFKCKSYKTFFKERKAEGQGKWRNNRVHLRLEWPFKNSRPLGFADFPTVDQRLVMNFGFPLRCMKLPADFLQYAYFTYINTFIHSLIAI